MDQYEILAPCYLKYSILPKSSMSVVVNCNQHARGRQHSENSWASLLCQMILSPFAHEAMIFKIVFSLLGILGGSFRSLVVGQTVLQCLLSLFLGVLTR